MTFCGRIHSLAFLLSWCAGAAPAAQTNVFTANTTIEETNLLYESSVMIVSNCTVLVNGAHTFESFAVLGTGRVSHASCTTATVYSLEWTITDTLLIESNAAIDVTSRGYRTYYTDGNTTNGGATDTSGGSYGGLGYPHENGSPNWVYGDFRNPNELGSGGAGDRDQGGPGGGLIRITATRIELDGCIAADGHDGMDGAYRVGGGGSGGGIFIDTDEISGSGRICANGGNRSVGTAAGGGGRVAVYYGTMSGLTISNITAFGGIDASSTRHGAPGTVYLKPDDGEGTLWIRNESGRAAARYTPFGLSNETQLAIQRLVVAGSNVVAVPNAPGCVIQADDVDVIEGGNLSHRHTTALQEYALELEITGSVYVDAASSIDASKRGYIDFFTVGNTTYGGATSESGGSYGGLGCSIYYHGYDIPVTTGNANAVYGIAPNPVNLGSGGAGERGSAGNGGGLIRLTAGSLTNDGVIRADGEDGFSNYNYRSGGGGSGGGLLLNVGSLAGDGTFSADGGNGAAACGYAIASGSGGGGRLALYVWQNNAASVDQFSVAGGTGGGGNGASGSLYFAAAPGIYWDKTPASFSFGTCTQNWSVLGLNPSNYVVNAYAVCGASTTTLETNQALLGRLAWDAALLTNGIYTLHLICTDSAGISNVLELTAETAINNELSWHSGTITNNETWSTGSIHAVYGQLTVATGATVTVTPGVLIKYSNGGGLLIQGALDAQGTVDDPIIMTSLADDSEGGDSNLDGNNSVPLPGDWTGLAAEGGTVLINDYTDIRYTRTTHGGTITNNEVWLGNMMHVLNSNLTISGSATLTINPGAIVKFGRNCGITVESFCTLTAIGQPAQPIIFTSIKDDTAGGDSNGDGEESSPAAGDWGTVYANGGAIEMAHTELRYGAGTANGTYQWGAGALRTSSGATLTMNACRITDSLYEGIHATEGGTIGITNTIIMNCERAINGDGATVQLMNCTLYANYIGLWPHGGTIDAYNTIIAYSLTTGICSGVRNVEYCNVWSPYGSNGNFTPGTDGNISTNPAFKNITNGNFRLNYLSPCIDAANTLIAPATDCMNAPRVNDPRTLVKRGVADTNGIYADMGAYEFTDNAESDVDLIAAYITGPTSAEVNSEVQVVWMVRNVGTESASGSWHDRMALVSGSGLNTVTTEVATVYHALPITLGPGKDVCFTNTVSVPGVTDGNWSWQVKVNADAEIYEGKNWTNNNTRSTAATSITVPVLSVGSSKTCRFDQDEQSRWYAVNTDAGTGLFISALRGTNTAMPELYLGAGYIPTRQTYDTCFLDTSSTGGTLQVQSTIEGTYYVMLYNASLAKGSTFTLSAAQTAVALESVTPDEVANGSAVTLLYSGTLLDADMTCRLDGPNLSVFTADSVVQNSAGHLRATFDLSAATPGYYAASVIHGGITNSLADAIQVVAGEIEDISYSMILPSAIRAGREAEILVQFVNNGNTDVDLSRLGIELEHATVIDSRYGYSAETNRYSVLLADNTGTTLAPGEKGTARLLIKADTTSTDVGISVYSSAMDESIDWAAMKEGFRPFFVPSAAWNISYARFTNEVGSSVRSYLQLIGRYKSYLVSVGVTELEEMDILQYAMMYAGAVADVAPNYTTGPFGYGGPNTMESRVYVQTNSDVIIGNSLASAYFRRTKSGTYTPQSGVFSTLTQINSTWKLRHKDGSVVTFASDGKPESVEYTWGNKLHYEYSGDRLTTVSNLLGNYKQYTYNGSGRITRIDTDSGRSTYLTYDAANEHLLTLSNELGRAQYTYYTNTPGTAQHHAIKTLTFPDQTKQYYFYDSAGRISRIEKDGGLEVQKFAYGPCGQVTLTNAAGDTVTWKFTDRSQLAYFKNEAGNLTRYEYDAETHMPTWINQAGLVTRCQYDSKGNLLTQQESDGGISSCAFNRSNSMLTAYSDLNGNTYRWNYGVEGTYTNAVYPDGTKSEYRSDAFGRTTQMIDRCGTIFTLRYAANNRVAGCDASDGSAINYEYNGYGELIAATNEHGTTTIQVDGAGRMTRITYPHGRWIAYRYNTAGQPDRISYDDGYAVDYSYNARGYLAAATNSNGLNLSCVYDNAGRITRINKGTARTEYEYEDGRLESIRNYAGNDSVLSYYVYGYDAWDNVTSMQTHLGNWTYGYDAAGRLKSAAFASSDTGVVPNHSVSFSYDAAGNRTALVRNGTPESYVVDSMNRYRNVGDATMTYDARGNMTHLTEGTNVLTFTYNAWNKPVAVYGPAVAWTNEYDALGYLIAREQNGVRTEYVMDAAFSLSLGAAYSGAAQTNHFIHAYGLQAQTAGASVNRYAMHDAVGSVSELVEPDGSVLNRYGYLPFGSMMLKAETVSNPFTFIGQWGVEALGGEWYRMDQRLYNASEGRFCAEDPLDMIHPNSYIYARNNPMGYVDPLGLASGKGNGPIIYMTTAEAQAYLDGNCAIRQKVAHALKGTLPSGKPGETVVTALSTALAVNSPAPPVLGTIESVTEAAPVTALGLFSFYTLKKDREFFEAIEDGRIKIIDREPQRKVKIEPLTIGVKEETPAEHQAIKKILQELLDQGVHVDDSIIKKYNLTKPKVEDPNEIVGPEGAGDEAWVSVNGTMPYVIYFENQTNATALVQWLTVTNVLDDQLDISTFTLGAFGIGTNRYSLPEGLQVFTTNVDMRAEYGVDVQYEATLDTASRLVTWTLTALDTNTGLLVEDPWLGFLPPNTNPPCGEGFVSYFIQPLTNALTGRAIEAQAGIQFEYNDVIMTPRITNRVDNSAPVSTLQLPPRSPRSFRVPWSGTDAGSGIARYDVYVSINSNAFTLWRSTNALSGIYEGGVRTNYAFLVRAVDQVGNMEAKTTADDATTVGLMVKNDFDGDAVTDIACYWPAAGMWYILPSATLSGLTQAWGWEEAVTVSGDYDGDGLCDIAVYWPGGGVWSILQSATRIGRTVVWGWAAAVPVPGDYDGDAVTDIAVYWPDAGRWYIVESATQSARTEDWGWSEAEPVPGDYDGDGITDVAVYWPDAGRWYIQQSSTQSGRTLDWGWNEAEPVPGDYDGDGVEDPSVYHAASGQWFVWLSATQTGRISGWGWSAAEPVPGDYDGDGLSDLTVYAPVPGQWYIWQSAMQTSRIQPWGWVDAEPVR